MSEVVQLSEEQRSVVEAGAGPLVVLAAAGAGKTRVLVERYLRCVAQGIAPDAILTITFTRKAAAEMKRRIVDALDAQGRRDDAQIAETGPIQTIHAFCQRLLRENALDAGIDPEVEILAEAQTLQLIEDAIEDVLTAPPDAPEVAALITALAGRRSRREAATAHARLKDDVRQVLQQLRGTGLSAEDVERAHHDTDATLVSYAGGILRALPPAVRAAYDAREGPLDVLALRAAYAAVKAKVPRWLRVAAGDVESAAEACGIVRIACEAWRRLDAAMDRLQSFDFAALEERAVHLLSHSPQTRARVRSQFQVVLVDEAQDVNPVQYALLDALQVDAMLVGDLQQSIYGFRQADVELFRERALEHVAHRLRRNYRSEDGVLRFVDLTFGLLWPGAYEPMLSVAPLDLDAPSQSSGCDGVELWLQRARDTAGTAVAIRDLVAAGERGGEIAVLVRTAQYGNDLVERLEALHVPAQMVGGSERFYTRLEVRDLANTLRALADPSDDFALLAVLRSPVANVSLDSMVLLGLESRVLARLATFDPPLDADRAPLEAFRAWFEPLSKYADRLAAWEVLAEVFSRSGYIERLALRPDATQRLANVRKLLRLAAESPELGPGEFAERVRGIQTLRHREGDAPSLDSQGDAITVMTVHKAKGLEFPVVVVPDTHRRPQRPAPVIADSRLGLVACAYGRSPGAAHGWLAELGAAREREEELRVLYVALTRACRRLCVTAHPQATQGSLAQVLGKAFGKGAEVHGVRVRDLDEGPSTAR